MPQDKFITRKRATLSELSPKVKAPLETFSRQGEKAGRKSFDKVYGPASEQRSNDRFDLDEMRRQGKITPAQHIKNDNLSRARLDAVSKVAIAADQNAQRARTSKAVTYRDAVNAKVGRERLASRAASKAGERPVVDTFDANKNRIKNAPKMGVLTNPMLGVAAAIADADKATGYKRAKYTGNFGGPSFSMNPYASSNSSYSGQSAMSKMMGVGKKGK